MKTITITSALVIAVILIGLALALTRGDGVATAENVSVINGQQIIEISVKGGYAPRKSLAKAGLPTIIRFQTAGTFDCSAAVRIPSLRISRNLPFSGVTDIAIGEPLPGTLQGSCGMGMYHFAITFKA